MPSNFSLLDGLAEELKIPAAESLYEDFDDLEDDPLDAIEATIDEELSDADIKAILDDENDDNEAADVEEDDEDLQAITDDALDEDLGVLESLMRGL